jgi:ribosome-associated protein
MFNPYPFSRPSLGGGEEVKNRGDRGSDGSDLGKSASVPLFFRITDFSIFIKYPIRGVKLQVSYERCYLDAMEIARTIVDVLEEKKGENIVLIDIREVAPLADYFVLCSGTSDRMLDGLANDVSRTVRKEHQLRPRVEGSPQDGWILADYGDVILHLFSPERRAYYSLEELWSQGKIVLHLQ